MNPAESTPGSGTGPETITRTELLAPAQVEALAGVLDLDLPVGPEGTVPPLWHWTFLMDRRAQRDLGPDGHPTSGLPRPPGPGRRRMFAGGRVTTHHLLRLGESATRTTSIVSEVDKEGRTGPLTFVTVRHEITQDGRLAILEEQDIVYRAAETGPLPAPPAPPAPGPGPVLHLDVDEALLFRFSALTYNAHRIHYDHAWAAHEGYPDLVVHGPLQALMMAEHMRREGVDLHSRTFAYRLLSPMIGPQRLQVVPGPDGLASGAETRSAAGAVCATSTLSAPVGRA